MGHNVIIASAWRSCKLLYVCAQAEALDPELSATDTLERAAPDAELQDIKALLGRMLFSGRAAHKKVLLQLRCHMFCLTCNCRRDGRRSAACGQTFWA
jgi:ATPase subunit of ABC transporter with duplicated ATPase domains